MTCSVAMTQLARCTCGGVAFVDEWMNHRLKKREVFVRCGKCGVPGPGADTDLEAIRAWDETHATPAD